jgi:aldehyde:ferredoxin oxidoreductase
MFGGHGKILRVNLSESKITEEEIPEELFDKYLTGAGLATHYLYHEVPKGADPLGSESELIFMNGTITGAQAPSTGRYNLVFK